MNKTEFDVIFDALTEQARQITKLIGESERKDQSIKKGFPYVSLNNDSAWHVLKYINRFKGTIFCEIGCGTNAIGLLAKSFGHNSFGIEYSEPLVKNAVAYTIKGNLLETECYENIVRLKGNNVTIFYSYSPLYIGIPEGPDNYKFMFKNLASIMRKEDKFIFVTISAQIDKIARKFFNRACIIEPRITVYKKK